MYISHFILILYYIKIHKVQLVLWSCAWMWSIHGIVGNLVVRPCSFTQLPIANIFSIRDWASLLVSYACLQWQLLWVHECLRHAVCWLHSCWWKHHWTLLSYIISTSVKKLLFALCPSAGIPLIFCLAHFLYNLKMSFLISRSYKASCIVHDGLWMD